MSNLDRPISMVRPGLIEFGTGVAERLGTWAESKGFRRVLVISDAFNASRTDVLGLTGEVTVYGDVKAEPDTGDLDCVLSAAEGARADLIVGFGGGSAMDLAKLVAVLSGSSQRLADVVGAGKVAGPREIALAQVPTTSGTGSEAGIRALVTDPETKAKLAVESIHMLADIAVIDPALTFTVPPKVTAATGVDAMAHCVEAFTNRKAHPAVDIYAIEGVRLVGRYLARAVHDGKDAEARAGLSLASLYGGYCLGPVNTAGGHALAYPLGTRWHVAHGAANALIFPHVLAFNTPAVPEKTSAVLEALGLSASQEIKSVFDAAHEFCASLGIEMKLRQLGVLANDLGTMADDAFAIRRLLDNNPRDLSRADILAIYEAAF
ncbi:iron-containing alcohol dehydrogenase (plasmid) [Sinorhizobium fredii NGR234]|uniref:Alcohol dehydrogenase n=1 Tax=Sinorhizobium fredii (strain NBRC 101917 / NGR234) TaxID=394 RepID=Q6W267_SINFN|nr:iron-containing alcohol dehydrogenase [Sinorhizobium fredii]AAQ87150.1 Alcohol dehydrogenase [Sinorhizobium fredii NGR234]ACP23168.1 iron-containing alcohol dehydrogenase [Sinorhizobium fredii NGR234]